MMVQVYFVVVGVFEFFVDYFVYFVVGVYQCCGDDGQVVVFFDVVCGIEEVFWVVQGVGVYIIGEYFVGVGYYVVVGVCQVGDGVEQDYYVFFVFDQVFGLFDYYFGNLDVVCGWFVEGGVDDFVVYGVLYFSYFFWMFVDEQYDYVYVWMVGGDCCGYLLYQYCFVGFGWGDDQCVLVFVLWCYQIYDVVGDVFG